MHALKTVEDVFCHSDCCVEAKADEPAVALSESDVTVVKQCLHRPEVEILKYTRATPQGPRSRTSCRALDNVADVLDFVKHLQEFNLTIGSREPFLVARLNNFDHNSSGYLIQNQQDKATLNRTCQRYTSEFIPNQAMSRLTLCVAFTTVVSPLACKKGCSIDRNSTGNKTLSW